MGRSPHPLRGEPSGGDGDGIEIRAEGGWLMSYSRHPVSGGGLGVFPTPLAHSGSLPAAKRPPPLLPLRCLLGCHQRWERPKREAQPDPQRPRAAFPPPPPAAATGSRPADRRPQGPNCPPENSNHLFRANAHTATAVITKAPPRACHSCRHRRPSGPPDPGQPLLGVVRVHLISDSKIKY